MDLLIILIITLAVTMKLTVWLLEGCYFKSEQMKRSEQEWDKTEWFTKEERENSLF